MNTLETANIPPEQLDALQKFVEGDAGPDLRDVLTSILRCIRDGDELVTIEGAPTVTPREAAERLGMSRTHLYKLLDRGEILSHRVGRDRRINIADLQAFEAQRQHDRRELAERFAHQNQTAVAATDEIADLL